jgi:hypothetical protein
MTCESARKTLESSLQRLCPQIATPPNDGTGLRDRQVREVRFGLAGNAMPPKQPKTRRGRHDHEAARTKAAVTGERASGATYELR